jgi:antirestriction protein ArdC
LTTPAPFGSKNYAREELIAEMGAAYLCAITGIAHATIENSAAYIQGWRDSISKDSKLVVLAAAQAQKAVNYIMGRQEEENHEDEVGHG